MADEQFPAAATALEEYQSIEEQMASPEVVSNPDKLRKLGRRHAELGAIVGAYKTWLQVKDDLAAAQEMAGEDADFAEEAKRLEAELPGVEEKLRTALIPRDPDDARDTIMEIKAGTGGEEAALFANSLLRMYSMYAARQGWKVEELDSNPTELGGYREVSFLVEGEGVFAKMKYESGVHRVQRVPETESQGRIQTSTVTVAVLPEAEEVDVEINPADLLIETFRSSGAGGQHINKTESAIRIIHKPTGTVVECQEERSQFKNKEKAMKKLYSKLYEAKLEARDSAIAEERRIQVGTGGRSERIRTYNFPQGRVTDHRIGLTLYKLDQVLDGDLDEIIDALTLADQAEKLRASAEEA